jgi:hypothetical protein
MNKEFKKIKGKLETRYVLESASAGATSSAAVATGPVGKKGNLLVQDKDGKPEIQRRNPVAANVNATVGGGGAGAHRDRKRAEKRGEQKHKKDWRRDVDEKIEEAQRLDPKCWKGYKKQGTKMKGGVRVNNCVPKESVEEDSYEEGLRSKLAGAALAGAMALGGSNPAHGADLSGFNSHYLQQVVKGEHPRPMVSVADAAAELKAREHGKPEPAARKPAGEGGFSKEYLQSVVDGTHPRPIISKEKAQELLGQMEEGYGMGSYSTVVSGAQISKAVPEAGVDPGYIDQENSMTSSDLKALYKQAVRLRDLIQKMGNDTTLEPWQQTKIAKAADYVNSVFRSLDDEYSISEDEKKGLWANIHARRKKGLPARKPGEKGAPTKKGWDAAVAASKKKKSVGEDNLSEYETHTYTDKMGRKWRVDDEGNKDLIYDPNDRFTRRTYSTPRQPDVYYFYNVSDGDAMKASSLGLKRTRSGKWYSSSPNAEAEKEFGKGRIWRPKNEAVVSEKMMPASHFAGTPKNKLGPAAHLKGKMKRPARQGDLVGGSAEESYSKKKTSMKS